MQENNNNNINSSTKKVLVSGIKPTGDLHFGNYFGAMRQNIELGNMEEYESYIFIADYHALTSMKGDRVEKLKSSTIELACAYIACGLDISKVTLFKQSSIPQVTELAWIFNSIVTMPYLMRAHAYKDHEAKDKEANVALFDYPVLMAADILIYGADLVPVGSDQKQHIEYARDIAGFYNRAWNQDYFKLPKEYILESVATVMGTDGEKMSKSKGNVISMFASNEEIKRSVMSIVTDSKGPEEIKNPDENNIYKIHKLFLSKEEDESLRAKFENIGYGYKQAKEDLLDTIMKWRENKKEKYDELMSDPSKILEILEKGGKKANLKALETMKKVRVDTGLDF
jgi:tryptophanyl-tRNA synthetase